MKSLTYDIDKPVPTTCVGAVLSAFNEPLELREIPVPEEIEPNAVLVAVETATICGSDVHLWDGSLTAMDVALPVIPGHEFVGRVVKMGSGAERDSIGTPLEIGDRIVWTHESCGACFACNVQRMPEMCDNRRHYMFTTCVEPPYLTGGFAEYCYVFPKSGRLRVPDNVKSEWASAGSCALRTVMQGFERLGRIAPWETVVIQGAGPLGLFATAVASRAGADRVITIGAPEARLELARDWGADVVVSVEEYDVEGRADRISELTEGKGADVVMEFSGAAGAFKEGLDFVRRGGRNVVVGQLGPAVDPILASMVPKKQVTILGAWSGTTAHYWQAMEFLRTTAGIYDYDSLISGQFALSDIGTALDRTARRLEIKPAVYPGGVPA